METLVSVKKDQNIIVVQNAFADFLKGNIQGILDVAADDITWSSFDNPGIPFAQTFLGKKGVEEFFAAIAGSIDYLDFQPREFFSVNDHVFVKGYHAATVRSTGRSFGHDFLMEFRVRNQKIYSFFAWVDTRDQAKAFNFSNQKQQS